MPSGTAVHEATSEVVGGHPLSPARSTVEEAVAALRRGQPVVVADDPSRENEGDLIAAGAGMSAELAAFMVRHSSGLLCAAMEGDQLDRLGLPQMVPDNRDPHATAFTISVDARDGVTTGISAADRARTVRMLADPSSGARDFTRPGHIFPLRAQPGGVLTRRGHTEAAVDLMRLAGLPPVGVLAEIWNDDGSVAHGRQLRHFARRHGLPLLDIADLVRHRQRHEWLLDDLVDVPLPTPAGVFRLHLFRARPDGRDHLALTMGRLDGPEPPLSRVHSECLTGDVLGSARCDCGQQLQAAMARIAMEGRGVIVYLRGQEGRGIGLADKLLAYRLQDAGHDTVEANHILGHPADAREYWAAAQILRRLGVASVRLLTNNPAKCRGLTDGGVDVQRVPLTTPPTPESHRYLLTKQRRLGHLLDLRSVS